MSKFIYKKSIILTFAIIVVSMFLAPSVFAVWSGTFYEPGDTLNPECLPTDTDCDVRAPLTSLNISDTVYGAGWDTDATHAPSKNAVYDQIQVLVASNHNPVTLGVSANGLSLATQVLSLALASTSTTGALSDTDWDTFNNKQDALSFPLGVSLGGTGADFSASGSGMVVQSSLGSALSVYSGVTLTSSAGRTHLQSNSTGGVLYIYGYEGLALLGTHGGAVAIDVETGFEVPLASVYLGGGAETVEIDSPFVLSLIGPGLLQQEIAGGVVTSDFVINTPVTADATADLMIAATAATQTPLVVQGAAAASVPLQEWQDSTGAVVANVTQTGAIGVRTALANAAGLYVPWVSGDAATTAYFGSTSTSNDQIAITAYAGTARALQLANYTNAHYVLGMTKGVSAATTSAMPMLYMTAGTSGAALAGFGGYMQMTGRSTTTNEQNMGRLSYRWVDPTHATRTAKIELSVYDYVGEKIPLVAAATGTSSTVALAGATTATASLATDIPLTVKGAAAQSVNLQEWSDSTPTVVASMSVAGALSIASTTIGGGYGSTGVTISDAGVIQADGAITAASIDLTSALALADGGTGADLSATGPGLLQQATAGAAITSDFVINTPVTADATADLMIAATAATQTPLVVQGAASASVPLQEWQDSTGAVVASINAAGAVSGGQLNMNATSAHVIKETYGRLGFTDSGGNEWLNLSAVNETQFSFRPRATSATNRNIIGFTQYSSGLLQTSGTTPFFAISTSVLPGAGSANFAILNPSYTINASGAQTGTVTGLKIAATETNLNGITHNLIDAQVATNSMFKVTNAGLLSSVSAQFGGGYGSTGVTISDAGAISADGLYTGTLGAIFNESGADSDFRVEGDTDANLLFVDASTDRVGIGTATPDFPLHVRKDQNAGTYLKIQNATSGTSAISGFYAVNNSGVGLSARVLSGGFAGGYANYGSIGVDSGISGLYFWSGDPVPFIFYNNATYFVMGASGNVGIGPDGTPDYFFDVQGALNADGAVTVGGGYGSTGVTISDAGAISADGALTVNTNSTTGLLVEQDGVKDNVLVVDTTNGRVGIGTATPLVPLHVKVATDENMWVRSINANEWQIASLDDAATTYSKNLTIDSYTLSLNGYSTGKVILAYGNGSGGNVGIGGDPDVFKLQVLGNVGPHSNNTYDLGSTARVWKKLYVTDISATGNIGIGNTTPANRFNLLTPVTADATADAIFAASSATQTPLVVQGAAAASAPLQEWQTSAGAVATAIQSGGLFQASNISETAQGGITFGTGASAGGSLAGNRIGDSAYLWMSNGRWWNSTTYSAIGTVGGIAASGIFQADDSIYFYTFPASSNTATQRAKISSAGLTVGGGYGSTGVTISDAGAISADGLYTGTLGAIFNESGADSDFRIEGDTDANLLFV
ncbi:MAG: Hemagglutinin family protein, partial [Parcubacteria group bacterium GW2011_GWA2_42_11]